MFLSERPAGVSGSAVTASMEGTRPVLIELQALVAPTSFATPKRMAIGAGSQPGDHDHGGVGETAGSISAESGRLCQCGGRRQLDEPAVDLAVAVSLASSFRDRPTGPKDVLIGEVGLTGEVRGVTRLEQRVAEAANMGFQRAILPKKTKRGWTPPDNLESDGLNLWKKHWKRRWEGRIIERREKESL